MTNHPTVAQVARASALLDVLRLTDRITDGDHRTLTEAVGVYQLDHKVYGRIVNEELRPWMSVRRSPRRNEQPVKRKSTRNGK